MPVAIAPRPLSSRPCLGLGFQADCYIYDDVNRQFGVTDADCDRWERRIGMLRPGIARIFLPLNEFNPSGDGATYDWETVEMQRQYRNLEVLRNAGARVNLCMGPWTNKQMTQQGSERWAVDLVEHLVRTRGCDHVHWLSLFNEPDAIYAPDTPLNEELKARGFGGGLPFADYIAKHRAAVDLLRERGLAGQVRLVVSDAVWPPRRRLEWLQLLSAEFRPDDVVYSFHHYSPDDDRFFEHPLAKPFQPPPLPEEARMLRQAVGPGAELACWEFNQMGWNQSGTAAWPGAGAHGEDHMGSMSTAIAHSRKVLTMLAGGIDGLAHWCVGDMFYRSGLKQGVMYCGLWRYRWESWVPRPVYFTYAALIDTFRPGCAVHAVTGLPDGIAGAAAVSGDETRLALVTSEAAALRVDLPPGPVERLRITLDRLPRRADHATHETGNEDVPLATWEPLDPADSIDLDANELTVLRVRGGIAP